MNSETSQPEAARSGGMADRASRPRQPSIEERRRLVAQSLSVGNPSNNAKPLPEVADPKFDCQLELPVDAIRPYDRNPRRGTNVKFNEIKESIRVCGIRNPITVTRRTGDTHFIVEAGGNTRLVAIQQLWAETKEPQFQKISVLFRPWRSESHVLTAHLIENDQRGELTFWDKACGVMELKAQLETETGRTLSLREFEEELKRLGMSSNRSTLSQSKFAIEKLSALGAAVSSLSGLDVKTIQPRLNLMKRYVEKRAGTAEPDIYTNVLNPVFERNGVRYAETHAFNAIALCQDCEQALADHLSEPVARLRLLLGALDEFPDLSLADLDVKVATDITAARTAQTMNIVRDATTGAPSVSSADSRTQPAQLIGAKSAAQASAAPACAHIAHSLPETATTPPSKSAALLALLEDVQQCVAHFARITNIADCLNFCEGMPCSYYMEVPQMPLFDQPLRFRAWWLLALLSGQMHEYVTSHLPPQSRWRRIHEREGTDESALTVVIESELGGRMSLDVSLTDWLLDSTNEAAALFSEIVVLIREIRNVCPKDVPTPDNSNAIAKDR